MEDSFEIDFLAKHLLTFCCLALLILIDIHVEDLESSFVLDCVTMFTGLLLVQTPIVRGTLAAEVLAALELVSGLQPPHYMCTQIHCSYKHI